MILMRNYFQNRHLIRSNINSSKIYQERKLQLYYKTKIKAQVGAPQAVGPCRIKIIQTFSVAPQYQMEHRSSVPQGSFRPLISTTLTTPIHNYRAPFQNDRWEEEAERQQVPLNRPRVARLWGCLQSAWAEGSSQLLQACSSHKSRREMLSS
ncbi:hypothetical protein FGO68_gene4287 [Halteria grandinella]|uniref:Uncharacterized protein n=1 Tax=Halteria grandinella TaxID=5974 RepID=A0A8J8T808_HALGN|nr:hypothetical protein FGO68_gene4287 [Halteria grandinella]